MSSRGWGRPRVLWHLLISIGKLFQCRSSKQSQIRTSATDQSASQCGVPTSNYFCLCLLLLGDFEAAFGGATVTSAALPGESSTVTVPE